ncbi:MAG: hypothetical protein Q9162_006410 [Coniocarpon cinnabarinum]
MPKGRALCQGSSSFEPDGLFARLDDGFDPRPDAKSSDLRTAIRTCFSLPASDSYVYHATASVTLDQVQQAVKAGRQHGLHDWYPDATSPPPTSDIDAYTSIFASTTATDKSLKAFAANAKKESIRAHVAQNIVSKRTWPPSIIVPKLKKPHVNPYLDFWSWSCRELEWCGPEEATSEVKQSHHILPVFFHHFGCACPTFEALEVIRQFAAGRAIIDAGSGNGYWSFMLRRHGLEVSAVDNGDSVWRTIWISDTVKIDAAKFIHAQKKGAADYLLLMVYPQVTTDFTSETIDAYRGDTIVVAGTQNSNGFTADVGSLLKTKGEWQKILQTPLPSFAGKDEALAVWKKTV